MCVCVCGCVCVCAHLNSSFQRCFPQNVYEIQIYLYKNQNINVVYLNEIYFSKKSINRIKYVQIKVSIKYIYTNVYKNTYLCVTSIWVLTTQPGFSLTKVHRQPLGSSLQQECRSSFPSRLETRLSTGISTAEYTFKLNEADCKSGPSNPFLRAGSARSAFVAGHLVTQSSQSGSASYGLCAVGLLWKNWGMPDSDKASTPILK